MTYNITPTTTSTYTYCQRCGTCHAWDWEEAFDKFGFGDGDGLVMTESVARTLREAGYAVTTHHWGMHNVIITSIKLADAEQIPEKTRLGYDNPRDYLPAAIVTLLDTALGGKEV